MHFPNKGQVIQFTRLIESSKKKETKIVNQMSQYEAFRLDSSEIYFAFQFVNLEEKNMLNEHF